jgi:diguanylate cyclase (GGDEF)-like protein
VGDQVLKEFGKWLSRSTRGSDLAARWGGDEFMLLLLDCQVGQLPVVLGRLDGFAVEVQEKALPVSFSVGWKAYERGDRIEEIIEDVDKNLYSHKAAGKAVHEPVTTPV